MDFSDSRLARLQDAVRKVVARGKSPVHLESLLAAPHQHVTFLEQLTAELTVGESFFFRNEHHFRALREEVIPTILRENAEKREIRVWSAGCAAGEEPYSLAILLDQMLAGRHWQVSILATDLNPKFLQAGREALYRPWAFRQTEIHHDRRYFTPETEAFRLVARLRGRVHFAYLNLVKDVYPSPLTGTLGLDLILFRNVAIYLRPEVTRAILARLHRALRPGGWLLLGEVEVNLASANGFTVRHYDQATFYQKGAEFDLSAADAAVPMPVLADVLSVGPPVMPAAPALPDWVPLPRKGTAEALPPAKHAAAESSPWERIERWALAGHFADAEPAIEKTLDHNGRARLRLRYAKLLLSCAQIARARQMLEICLKEDPLLVESWLLQAGFAEEAGDLAAAEQAYRRALYVDRSAPMAHFHLGMLLEQKADRAGARHSFQTTLKLIQNRGPHELVEYGEGICCGRLREMVTLHFSNDSPLSSGNEDEQHTV